MIKIIDESTSQHIIESDSNIFKCTIGITYLYISLKYYANLNNKYFFKTHFLL